MRTNIKGKCAALVYTSLLFILIVVDFINCSAQLTNMDDKNFFERKNLMEA